MQKLVKNRIVTKDLNEILNSSQIDWNEFEGKTFYITGATGTIGSFIIRALRHVRKHLGINISIVASARNKELASSMFKKQLNSKDFDLHIVDVNNKIKYKKEIDYIIHTACATTSKSFVENPADVYKTIINGTENVLNFAKEKSVHGMVFLSSMEVYGDVLNSAKSLKEEDLGSIDMTNARSSYPEGKRTAEYLCYAYAKEYSLPVKIARLAQVIGANVEYQDTRVYAQFVRSIVDKEDIVLKTRGEKTTSQCYISDAITAIFTILLKGDSGSVYNVANSAATTKIVDIAKMLCEKYPNTNLKFDISDESIYPKETYWNLDTTRLNALGWAAKVSLPESYNRLIDSFYMQKIKEVNTEEIDISEDKKRNEKKLSFCQQIFSLTNLDNRKQLCVLGLKIRFKLKKRNLYEKYKMLPIEQNKIVFCNFKGLGYGCNPKYIAEEIIKRKLPYELVWLTKFFDNSLNKEAFPEEIRLVSYKSKEAIKELATAKMWVDNQRKIHHIKQGLQKKEGQFYIQTFHGSLGIKKVGVESNATNTAWVEYGIQDAEYIDYLISNSVFEDEVYKKCFFCKGVIEKLGHARNDIFFVSEEQKTNIRNKVFENLNIQTNKKIALYVPSYRDDMRLYCYSVDIKGVKNALEQKFGGEWCVVIRMHPNIIEYSSLLFDFSDNCLIDGSLYPDIQELLVSSDIAITDYSSCIFDFMLSRKPGFIFATDIEDFNTDRGFYYPLESTPFPVATNNQELLENIKNFDIEKYKSDVGAFLKEKGCMEDGHASERAVDLIEEIIKNG